MRGDHGPHDAQARPLRAKVLLVAGLGPVGDDAFHVPLVDVKKEANQGLLVIGVATGLRHARDAEVVSRVRGACPRCGAEQDFAAGNRLAPTWTLDCPTCHNTLTLALEGRGGPPA